MMTLDTRKNTFIELGKFLSQFKIENYEKKESVWGNDLFFENVLL